MFADLMQGQLILSMLLKLRQLSKRFSTLIYVIYVFVKPIPICTQHLRGMSEVYMHRNKAAS